MAALEDLLVPGYCWWRRAHVKADGGTAEADGGTTESPDVTQQHLQHTQLRSVRPHVGTLEDYYARFGTFAGASSIPEDKIAQVFLTSQIPGIYKLLGTLAAQQTLKDINAHSMEGITQFMRGQFDPKRFIVRERFKFMSDMQRRPGETVLELAARIHQDATTCDFASIKDPQDESMRIRLVCSLGNEAVLKAVFKISDDELTFSKAVQVAVETEDAAKVAKETIHVAKASATTPVLMMRQKKASSSGQKGTSNSSRPFPKGMCPRCGKTNHVTKDCRFMNYTCRFCHKGHIAKVLR
ncbi:hypothetical protein O3P69_003446 [Scylla paramamosain]|uniref:CCHC-type domain-containing protein n=1 Tax=Scylla paramamosain TaxID=85552 RepID=A0AAW0UGQ6_SCYPA